MRLKSFLFVLGVCLLFSESTTLGKKQAVLCSNLKSYVEFWLSSNFGLTVYLSSEERLGNSFLLKTVEKAKKLVDEAYKYSREVSLQRVRREDIRPSDVLRLMKQPSREARNAVRAADTMEIALILIQEKAHRIHKRSINATDLLNPDQRRLIVEMTGCAVRTQQPSCRTTPFVDRYRSNPPLQAAVLALASNTPFTRWLAAEYEDGISQPKGWNRTRLYNNALLPLVREVSNSIIKTTDNSIQNDQEYSYLVTLFGQWNDHDLSFTPHSPSIRSFSNGIDCDTSCQQSDPCFPIRIPNGDPRIPSNTCMPLFRSAPTCGSGNSAYMFGDRPNAREQINTLTAFLDVGQVYGSEDGQARDLRDLTNDGGLLLVNDRFIDPSGGRALLPFSSLSSNMCATHQAITNSSGQDVPCFIAGDSRVVENIALTSLHTLFLREHNRLARALRQLNPTWSSETLYQEARKIMGGYHQVIVFRDYLTHIVGPDAIQRYLGRYPGYNENVDPSISNVFATAAYRFAHNTLQPLVFRLDENYQEHPQFPSVPLFKTFFAPWRVVFEGGIDPLIRGLVGRPAKLNTQDHMMVDAVRDRLFQFTSKLALDLASLNMQRGRDHALPGYNAWRRYCNLSTPQNEVELGRVLNNTSLARELLRFYRTPDNIDVWLGGVSEPFVPGGRVGPLFACLISLQFQRIRQGDRLWWENDGVFTVRQRAALRDTSLARIICDNTGIRDVPLNPFIYRPRGSGYTRCEDIPVFDLRPWLETVGLGNLISSFKLFLIMADQPRGPQGPPGPKGHQGNAGVISCSIKL
uniref:Eosinophil peroxidase n=1 Tax=Denticeps clupeoides TaxID=299321 RepID=A0AAY4B981_9TELE